MNTTPKISVIFPVYNTEKYLRRCIDSILSQTFTDFELLLIDDGSKDSSGTICDEYAAKDNRVRVFHKANGGVSSARNLGLDNVKGEWITFVDADDFIPCDSLKSLYNNNSEDLIIGHFQYHNSDDLFGLPCGESYVEQKDFGKFLSLNIDSTLFRVPWCKLYKSEIIDKQNLRFNCSLVFGEDTIFVNSYLLHSNSIRVCKEYCYNYYSIGDDYIKKYIKYSDTIYYYYEELKSSYNKLASLYQITGIRCLYGIIFDVLKRSFDNGELSVSRFSSFISSREVAEVLKERKSLHIRILLFLAKYSRVGLYLYNKLTKIL